MKWTCQCGKNPAIFWPNPAKKQGAGYCEKCFRDEQQRYPQIEMPREWFKRQTAGDLEKIPRANLIGLAMHFRHRVSHLRWYARQPGSSGEPVFFPNSAAWAQIALAVLSFVPTRFRGSRKLRKIKRELGRIA
jgi:hypothetical protein